MPTDLFIGMPVPAGGRGSTPPAIFVFAMHDRRAMVYTFSDSDDDRATLANLVRTGDVLKIVYGHEMSLDISTTVRVSGGLLRIEHTDAQG
jgi:hypothetical protein